MTITGIPVCAAGVRDRERLARLVGRHRPEEFPAGVVRCVNCGWDWPCRTALAAVNDPGTAGHVYGMWLPGPRGLGGTS